MKTQCPHCRTFFNVKPEYIGKKARCKKCAQGFTMLEAQAAAPVYDSTALVGTTVIPGHGGAVASPPAYTVPTPDQQASQLRQTQFAGPDTSTIPPLKIMPSVSATSAVPRQNAFPSQVSSSFDDKPQAASNSFVDVQAVAAVIPLESKMQASAQAEIQVTALPVSNLSAGTMPDFYKNMTTPARGMPESPAVNSAVMIASEVAPSLAPPSKAFVKMPMAAVYTQAVPPQMQVQPSASLQPAAQDAMPPRFQPPDMTPQAQAPKTASGPLAKAQVPPPPSTMPPSAPPEPAVRKALSNSPGQGAPNKALTNSPFEPMPAKPLVQSPMLPSKLGLKIKAQHQGQISSGKSAFQPNLPSGPIAERSQDSKQISAAQGQAIHVTPAMTRNLPGPHIAQIKVEAPAPAPKKFIPTSWIASLPTEVVIDGQRITPSVYGDEPAFFDAGASPLPLDVQHRFDDQQAVTLELFEGPVTDGQKEKNAPLVFSPIELDENQSAGPAAHTQISALTVNRLEDEVDGFFIGPKAELTMELEGLSADKQTEFSHAYDFTVAADSISVVDRLPLIETKPLKIGAVEGRARRSLKPKSMLPKRIPQFPPPGIRPPMFPRVPVAPDNLVAPEFIEEYVPKGPGPLVKAVVVTGRTIYRAFKSVSIAGYWFLKRQFDKVPRPVLTSSVACLLIGVLVGAWILHAKSSVEIKELQVAVSQSQELLQSRQSGKIESLYKERDRLSEDLLRVAEISREYPEGSIPKALAMAASEELKIADALLLQQIAAIESGAKVTVSVKQTTPDPNLASTLEEEMNKLQKDVGRQLESVQKLAEGPKMLADTGIATQLVSLAVLNRNHLIAKYGLSSPLPLQYQSGAYAGAIDGKIARAASDDSGFNNDQLPGLLEELRQEVDRLRAENELLLNSDSTLYASAVTDMGVGHLNSAKDKFSRLLKVYPASNLVPKTHEGLAQVKVMSAQKEAAKKPPVQVALTSVRHDGGYFKNETYVRISFRNVSNMMIKKLEFQVLTFDEHGYPVGSKRLSITDDNTLSAVMAENVPAGKSDYGAWDLSEKVRQVKVKLKEVEFYEAPTWRDEDIERWVEKESVRFVQAKGQRN